MTITLQRYLTSGDTTYVGKMNDTQQIVEDALNTLFTQIAAVGGASISLGGTLNALFGPVTALVGEASYVPTGSGANLSVAAGYAWVPTAATLVQAASPATINFTGLGNATYYIDVDATGAVSRQGSSGAQTLYAVAWNGTAFGTVARVAPLVFGYAEDEAAQVSAALAATFNTIDERLEAGETKAVSGDLARTAQTGRLSKSVAGSIDVTLSAVEANNVILNFTGVLTGNINVIVPLGTNPRMWIVTNNTTGAFSLTVKGATGSGVAVTQSGFSVIYQDGTNVQAVIGSGQSQPYDIPSFYPGVPPASAYFYRGRAARSLTIDPALMSGSNDTDASATATANYVVTLKAAGSAKATATWLAGNTQANLATTGNAVQTITKGALIEIIGQVTPDATLANPSWTILATR